MQAGRMPCRSKTMQSRASLELHIDLRQHRLDLGLRFGQIAFGAIDELEFFEKRERGQLRQTLIRQLKPADFELFELREIGGELQAFVAEMIAMRQRHTLERRDGFDRRDAFR